MYPLLVTQLALLLGGLIACGVCVYHARHVEPYDPADAPARRKATIYGTAGLFALAASIAVALVDL